MIAIMRGHDYVSLETSIWETGKKTELVNEGSVSTF